MQQPSTLFTSFAGLTILVAASAVIFPYVTGTIKAPSPAPAVPPLTMFRWSDGVFFADRHLRKSPNHYVLAHAIPASIWVLLIPLQLSHTVRKQYPWLHRLSGYTTLSISTLLCISGLLFPVRNLSYTHENTFHMHRVGPFAWPTFEVASAVAAAGMLITGYKALSYARQRKFELHRRWAIYHSLAGYVIPAQRWFMGTNIAFGALVAALRKAGAANEDILARIGLPAGMSMRQISRAELGSMALSAWSAGVLIIAYAYYLRRGTASKVEGISKAPGKASSAKTSAAAIK